MNERTAVRLQPAFEHPERVKASVEAAGPYWCLARYAANNTERVAVGADEATTSFVPPWFRTDFALGGRSLVDGADEILHNPLYATAASEVFGGDGIVVPDSVYVNVMAPSAMAFVPHLDIPAFRGARRDVLPLWLLQRMRASMLFEPYRVRIATAVSWFYEGDGGSFHYWPDGPDAPQQVVESPYDNVAVVADNELTFHGVSGLGDATRMPRSLSADAEMWRDDTRGDWVITDDGETVDRYTDAEVRMTVSWKAEVYRDEVDRQRTLDHHDDLTMGTIVDTFVGDLTRRGIDHDSPDDPLTDESWIRTLTGAYPDSRPVMS